MNKNIYTFVCFVLLFGLTSLTSFAQVCKEGMVLHFSTNSSEITPEGKKKLDSLSAIIQKSKESYIEILGHTDSAASEDFNFKLADSRINSVKEYLTKANTGKTIDVKGFNMGETRPLYKNATAKQMALNRRVEVYYYPVIAGKVMLKESNGASITLDKKYFMPCGICAMSAVSTEILVGDEAKGKVNYAGSDGTRLVTAGMVRLERDCAEQPTECTKATIRIPSPYNDKDMKIWASTGKGADMKWEPRKESVKYDDKAKEYVLDVDLCNKVGISLNRPANRNDIIKVGLPELSRTTAAAPYIGNSEWLKISASNDTSFITNCTDCQWTVRVVDSGVASNGYTYRYNGPIKPGYRSTEDLTSYYGLSINHYRPVVNYTDSNVLIKWPKKYAKQVRLYLPGIDSAINMKRYNNAVNKFRTRKPAHDHQIICKISKKERYYVDAATLRFKFKPKTGYYVAKVKKKSLQPITEETKEVSQKN